MNAASWCMLCRRCVVTKDRTVCERCERLEAIGFLVVMAIGRRVVDRDVDDSDVGGALSLQMFCGTLDAIAFLMIDRGRLFARMNKGINDESIAGQRAARDAYSEGQLDADRARDRW